jgi:hypothetical protein
MALLSNPISHRYFLPIFVITSISFTYIIQFIKSLKIKVLLSSFILINIFIGNFWIYPEKYGNGWDTSIKSLSYFEIRDKMFDYIKRNNIETKDIGTEFPIFANLKFSDLKNNNFNIMDMDIKGMQNHKYIIQSNISNSFSPEEIELLNNKWIKVVEYQKHQVYIKLFRNPNN